MKKYIYIFAAIAVACCLVLVSQRKHFSTWDVSIADANGHEPYDMAVFDSLLYRSLPNGYEVRHWDVADADKQYYTDDEDTPRFQDIKKRLHLTDSLNPKKQSVLIVQRTAWRDSSEFEVNTLIDALDYANKGGNVLVVKEQIEYYDYFLNTLTKALGSGMDVGQHPSGYTATDLSEREDDVYFVNTPDGKLRIRNRFAPSYLIEDSSSIQESKEALSIAKEMKLSIKPYLSTHNNSGRIYGVVFHNEKSGGKVYLCTLGLYFSNLGITIPDADKVIAYNMGKIDNKPVVRVDYEKFVPSYRRSSSKFEDTLSVLSKNEALSFAWTLVLLMAVLVLVCGIYRKHPAKRDAHLIYVDETDPVAVREAKFRQSPLLHFIFQYSWLYKGKRNYTELFLINYRQFARYVNRKSGVELTSADKDKLHTAANALAMRTGLDLSDIRQDLIMMRKDKLNADNGEIISPEDYIRSQQIIEKYL